MTGKYNKPDFLVVGAAKSGTTSLFHYLNQHPDIYVPEVKECRFFSQLPKNFRGLGAEFFPNSGITDEKEYFNLFKGYGDKVCGDISNDYLYYYKESIQNIKKYLGDEVKIIMILRNPIDRAYSNYMHALRDGWEDENFEEAIIKERHRIDNNWAWPYHYIEVGMYYRQVKAYVQNFKNVKIYLYEDLKNINDMLSNIYTFLGVEGLNIEITRRYNISGMPKNKLLHNICTNSNILKKLLKPLIPQNIRKAIRDNIKIKNLKKVPMRMETRKYLIHLYQDDIGRLEKLIRRDLLHWKNI